MANTLYDALTGYQRDPAAPFLIIPGPSAGQQNIWTWGDFSCTAARFAHVLTRLGVQKGDRVAVQVSKSPEAFALYLGCVQAGAVYLPMNTAYTAAEVLYFLNDAEPCVFVCDPAREAEMRTALQGQTHQPQPQLQTLDAAGKGSLSEAAAAADSSFRPVAVKGNELASVLYTSGTTGRSKGAMLSHDNLLSNSRTLQHYWQFTADDVLLNALPIYHTHGLFTAGNTLLLCGGSILFPHRFVAAETIDLLSAATTMMGVPTFYTRLLEEVRFTREAVAHMRLFISGSAPLQIETHIAFEDRTGMRILERYGMTETGMNTSNPYAGERRPGTVGFPLPEVSLRVVNPETGELCATDTVGMIEVRGPNVFSGYWRMPEKTAAEMTDDGYFITGDIGKFDHDGYVHIVGRDKDLIISGGFNIYPKEVELLLDAQPGVLESAVVGAPHPDFGEGVVAFVVGDGSRQLDIDELQASVAERLARFKRPGLIHLLDELPRNTMGKVQKNLLREQAFDSYSKH